MYQPALCTSVCGYFTVLTIIFLFFYVIKVSDSFMGFVSEPMPEKRIVDRFFEFVLVANSVTAHNAIDIGFVE